MHFGQFLLKEKCLIGVLFIADIIIAVASLSTPYFLSLFIDDVSKGDGNYLNIIVILVICYLCGTICSYIASVTQVKAHYRIAFEYNKNVIKHVQNLPLSFFDCVDTVYLNKRINDDV